MLKKTIDLIISSVYQNEAAREFINAKPNIKVIKKGSDYKRVDVNKEIVSLSNETNHLIEKHLLKSGGRNKITEMCYELISIFKTISYLSEENRNKVKAFIEELK